MDAGLGALVQRAETLLSEAEAAGSRCDVMRAERMAFAALALAPQAGEVATQELVRHERQQLRLFTSQGEACKSLLLDALRLEVLHPLLESASLPSARKEPSADQPTAVS